MHPFPPKSHIFTKPLASPEMNSSRSVLRATELTANPASKLRQYFWIAQIPYFDGSAFRSRIQESSFLLLSDQCYICRVPVYRESWLLHWICLRRGIKALHFMFLYSFILFPASIKKTCSLGQQHCFRLPKPFLHRIFRQHPQRFVKRIVRKYVMHNRVKKEEAILFLREYLRLRVFAIAPPSSVQQGPLSFL
jgi:hypothetical protein